MRLVGMYEHSLDAKGRIILPAKFRGNFDSNLALLSKHREGCLAIWTPEAFDKVAAEMAARMRARPRSGSWLDPGPWGRPNWTWTRRAGWPYPNTSASSPTWSRDEPFWFTAPSPT